MVLNTWPANQDTRLNYTGFVTVGRPGCENHIDFTATHATEPGDMEIVGPFVLVAEKDAAIGAECSGIIEEGIDYAVGSDRIAVGSAFTVLLAEVWFDVVTRMFSSVAIAGWYMVGHVSMVQTATTLNFAFLKKRFWELEPTT
jgi:hypothetical protein